MKVATKEHLRQELVRRRHVGAQMANLCFNLSQRDDILPQHRKTLNELYREWDSIQRADYPYGKPGVRDK